MIGEKQFREMLDAIRALAGAVQPPASVGAQLLAKDEATGETVPIPLDAERKELPTAYRKSPRLLAQQLLDTGDTVVYTAPGTVRECQIYCVNVAGSRVTFQLHNRRAAAADGNARIKGKPLRGAGGICWWDDLTLREGDIISGLCSSANGVNVEIYGEPE